MKKITMQIVGGLFILPHLIIYLTMKTLNKSSAIILDIERWIELKHKDYGDITGLIYLLLKFPEFRSLYYHRLGKIRSLPCRYLPGRINLYFGTPSSRIGGGFYVGHGWGTVVNAKKIGENCGVAQNCTIGSRNMEEPVLENDVMVWAHSIVLGNIVIGENSQIGSGSVVVKSVPRNSVVVPAKSVVIKHDGKRVNMSL